MLTKNSNGLNGVISGHFLQNLIRMLGHKNIKNQLKDVKAEKKIENWTLSLQYETGFKGKTNKGFEHGQLV